MNSIASTAYLFLGTSIWKGRVLLKRAAAATFRNVNAASAATRTGGTP